MQACKSQQQGKGGRGYARQTSELSLKTQTWTARARPWCASARPGGCGGPHVPPPSPSRDLSRATALRRRRSGARAASSRFRLSRDAVLCLSWGLLCHVLLELSEQELKKRDLHLGSGERRGARPPPGGKVGLRSDQTCRGTVHALTRSTCI